MTMNRFLQGKTAFIGAIALALGLLALWLRSDAVRIPGREASESDLTARPDLERDAAACSTPVGLERTASETLDRADAPPAHADALRVDVVDASGRPAIGVSIACGIVSSSAPEVFDARLRARTDASGSAWLELSGLPHPADRRDDSLRLRAEILADPLPEIALALPVTEEHVVLRLPPAGSVRLEVAGTPGAAATAAVRFGVWARAAGATRDVEALPRWIAAPTGVALLEHVGTGLELRVAAALEDDEARTERVVASGPRFDGEERTISVPLGAPWPTLLVRALDEHGNVLRNELMRAEVRWSRTGANPTWVRGGDQTLRVRTDDEGRARLPLRGTVAGGFTRRLVLTHGDEGAREGGVLRLAERDLSWPAAAGDEIDLGDVELRPMERGSDAVIWVSGSVTDDAGSPVPSATVLVSAVDADGKLLPGPNAQVEVEPDGRFVVTGPPVEQRLSVSAIAPGFLRSTKEVVAAGAGGLQIRVQAAARWAGRLLLDADIPLESLVVEVIQSDRRVRTIPASERVAVDGLEPGHVDVEVRTRTGDWTLGRWELLPTFPSATPSEERANELDLRGRVARLRLRLVEPDGAALDRVFAHVHPEPWPEGGCWIRDGRLDLVVPGDARTIAVRPRGYPSVSVGLLDGIQELTCGPRIAGGAL